MVTSKYVKKLQPLYLGAKRVTLGNKLGNVDRNLSALSISNADSSVCVKEEEPFWIVLAHGCTSFLDAS